MSSQQHPLYSPEELDELRRYADELVPGSYEQERVKLAIALRECVNACSPLFWPGRALFDFVLLVQAAGLLAAIRITWRALVALTIHTLDGRGGKP